MEEGFALLPVAREYGVGGARSFLRFDARLGQGSVSQRTWTQVIAQSLPTERPMLAYVQDLIWMRQGGRQSCPL